MYRQNKCFILKISQPITKQSSVRSDFTTACVYFEIKGENFTIFAFMTANWKRFIEVCRTISKTS